MNIVRWRYNAETKNIELVGVLEGSGFESSAQNKKVEITIEIPAEQFLEIIQSMPQFDDEARILEVLDQIQELRKKRVLSVEGIDKEIDVLRGKLNTIRNSILSATDKNAAAKYTVQINSISKDKGLLDSRRFLVKQLKLEEADLRAQLQKIMALKLVKAK
jgi:hypothetical protein